MTLDPTPVAPVVVTKTTSVFSTVTFWGVIIGAIATVWQATGFGADQLGKFNAAAPLIIQTIAALGILSDHLAAAPRKVALKGGSAVRAAAVMLVVSLLIPLTGCPPLPPATPTTQPNPNATILAAEQAQINTVNIALSIGYDAWTLYSVANPNPVENALAIRTYNAVQAAIATAQGHINAGDTANAQLALQDVQAAFLAFVTSTSKSQVALHAKAVAMKASNP